MAVRHGYGKVAGTDALVFAYDTGDTRNSYRGEPTTNLLPAGVALGHNSGAYGNVVTVTDATAEKGPGWKKVTISNRGSNFRIIQWSYISMLANITYCFSAEFDWGNMRGKGYYINHDGDGGGSRTFYLPGNYTTGQGSILSITSSVPDGKIAGIISRSTDHTHSFFINNPTTGVSGLNDYFYYKDFQVEINTHPTQHTTGTRSSTQGLLDLTGRGTVDLTNTSFDANAQPFFDGTDDRIVVPYSGTDLNGDPLFTVEGIFKRTGASMSGRGFWGIGGDVSDQGISGYTYSGSGNNIAIDLWGRKTYRTNVDYPLNKYVHVVWVKSAPTFTVNTIAIYINGVEYTGASLIVNRDNAATVNLNTGNVGKGISIGRIGPQTNLYYGIGEVPVFKVYNKALTADEVRNNFQQYKTRFNI